MPDRTCRIDGCDQVHYGRGWCRSHWKRNNTYGDPLYYPTRPQRLCSVEDCDRVHYSLGRCRPHYRATHSNETRQTKAGRRRYSDPNLCPTCSREKQPRGHCHAAERFHARVDRRGPDDCWPWTGALARGYGTVRFDLRSQGAHRVAWSLANDRPVPAGMEILHSCDNPPCCNPAHLRPGTVQENAADRVARDRSAKGHKHGKHTRPESRQRALSNGNSKLDDAAVAAIRARITGQYGELKTLAREFGVSASLVMKIKAGDRR